MKKIEIIWRELLFCAIEKKKPAGETGRQFTQKELAKKFGFSTSTVFQALKIPRKMGAVRVTGRNFVLEDAEKLLYHWASVRDLGKDIILSGQVSLPILEIEGRMPPEVVYGGFSAARQILDEVPADYDKVYIYINLKAPRPRQAKRGGQISNLKSRFEFTKGTPNLFVLKADPFLENYGQKTTLAQTFVDLWNLPSWYAKEFVKALKEKIDEFLP